MATSEPNFYLFGGYKSWNENAWSSSDDRVRGGKSKSYLECSPESNTVTFHGTLDISTLKGAGFAAQRTVDPQSWDLFDYQGLRLGVGKADAKRYTLVVKDEVPPPPKGSGADAREESSSSSSSSSTVSWEFDFVPPVDGEVSVRWEDFKPTFFGAQEGPFKLELRYIAAIEPEDKPSEDKPEE
ncbi:NADH:ubiquinone oxidoreductase complex I intermediate-associated protein 30 [Annulohypoxylon truncatum]|uniref:NADH:ubiquinone oxidoreductase complex I intermediate-associated protein 30 n=1 Tax=Annulohypoxylon truncatum TaxID=327061 RepID=UPI002008B8AF|nr:NADH:ubiquinone oxidoreductase complex I intermediate-associated protein 30 [Annulohypoxylon truncatum]KAI1208601.1 NADH:ubiquinone oxidoreductase complex I intermediate-associated protein 30 [Annulohypoxylon truncatum]